MSDFDKIYLTWRKGAGFVRTIIGEITSTDKENASFRYLLNGNNLTANVDKITYVEFPDVNTIYQHNVLDIFGHRLVKTERLDSKAFYDFWEVDQNKISDVFYLLGKTQALVATDNFEFLANYKFQDKVNFVTEVVGLSHLTPPLQVGDVEIGDELSFRPDPENEADNEAIAFYKGDRLIGYTKLCHNKVFQNIKPDALKITVKALEKNGVIKRIFIRVFTPSIPSVAAL